jgi:enamine deaminase RidA (YjgF/YER057c/UK114 family)
MRTVAALSLHTALNTALRAALCTSLATLAIASANAQEVTRYPLGGGSKFPIARAVEVPAGTALVFHSGMVPDPADPKAPKDSPAYWGDTRTQALSVFTKLKKSLDELGLSMGDAVKMTAFLVADPASKDGRMDFKGFMDAYTQFYGTAEQPKLPSRSAVQVAALAGPGMLVEVEVILARPPKH